METLKKAFCSNAMNTAVLIITSLIIAWGFIEIRDFPKVYVTKQEMRDSTQNMNDRFDKIDRKLDAMMDIYIQSFRGKK